MKLILLYQQCSGHLAQWTAMNNSARSGAIDTKERGREERRGRKVEPSGQSINRKTQGERGDRRVGVCQDVSDRKGETLERKFHNQTCWVNSEGSNVGVCVCVCVCLIIQRPLCAALCRCLCTNTLGRPSRARLWNLALSSLHPNRSAASLLKLVGDACDQHLKQHSVDQFARYRTSAKHRFKLDLCTVLIFGCTTLVIVVRKISRAGMSNSF